MSDWKQLSPSVYHQLALGSVYGLTDVGRVRSSNEDNFLIDQELGLVVVGDGMGGHEDGEIASANAITLVRDFVSRSVQNQSSLEATLAHLPEAFDPDATWSDQTMPAMVTLFEAIEFANAQLYAKNLAKHRDDGIGMGTTLTGFWHIPNAGQLVVFHVGDSRLYRYRHGELTILTRDQTLYQQAIEEGMIDNFPERNLLLQAIGPAETVKPDVKSHSYEEGDLYMLCSDGLYGNPPHSAIEKILAGTHAQNLEQRCTELIDLAKGYGSRDNITAVLTLCHGRPAL